MSTSTPCSALMSVIMPETFLRKVAKSDRRERFSAPIFSVSCMMPQAVLTEAPPARPGDEPGRFPVHKLVLALCGALGAASALRFIVRA